MLRGQLIVDILIANGAKRMDRQDAVPPRSRPTATAVTPVQGGLPVSPHPPARQLAPDAAHGSAQSRRDADVYTQYIDPAPADFGANHSPETSGSDAEAVMTPREKGEVQRWPSNKRKPVPPIEPDPHDAVEELHESHDGHGHVHDPYDRDHGVDSYDRHDGTAYPSRDIAYSDNDRFSYTSERSEGPIPPIKDRPILGEVIAPRPQRDTIHNIVDTYRDSVMTTSSEQDDSEISFRHEGETEYTSRFKDDPHLVSPEKRGRGEGEEEVLVDRTKGQEVEREEEELGMPKMGGPVFDLTPGREPSPARYKHGEPLQFGKWRLYESANIGLTGSGRRTGR